MLNIAKQCFRIHDIFSNMIRIANLVVLACGGSKLNETEKLPSQNLFMIYAFETRRATNFCIKGEKSEHYFFRTNRNAKCKNFNFFTEYLHQYFVPNTSNKIRISYSFIETQVASDAPYNTIETFVEWQFIFFCLEKLKKITYDQKTGRVLYQKCHIWQNALFDFFSLGEFDSCPRPQTNFVL